MPSGFGSEIDRIFSHGIKIQIKKRQPLGAARCVSCLGVPFVRPMLGKQSNCKGTYRHTLKGTLGWTEGQSAFLQPPGRDPRQKDRWSPPDSLAMRHALPR